MGDLSGGHLSLSGKDHEWRCVTAGSPPYEGPCIRGFMGGNTSPGVCREGPTRKWGGGSTRGKIVEEPTEFQKGLLNDWLVKRPSPR